MLKWSKYKTKEEVLSDLKSIFDKYDVKDVSTITKRFWENGDIELFFIESTDPVLVKNLKKDLEEYYFDLDEFTDGCCSAIVYGKVNDNHIKIHEFYSDRKITVYKDGKWVI